MAKKNVKLANKANRAKLLLSLSKAYPPSPTSTPLPSSTPTDQSKVTLDLQHGNALPAALQAWIFSLFELNMKAMFEASTAGYDRDDKFRELFHPDSRFVIAREEGDGVDEKAIAFAMFRFDTEQTAGDRHAEVLYCYEVQVSEAGRGRGVGTLLVEVLARLGKEWAMEKVMLTVFKANDGALALYRKTGFLEDEISPGACGHPNEDYEILSRPCV
ncbi:hypothetical protein RQP46_005873 [Phenoliferia psychrophenolica]